MSRRTPSFVEFLRLCGVRPSTAQRVLWSVIADGVQPSDLRGDDRRLARELFGDVDRIPPELRSVVAIVVGARSGKTHLSSLCVLWRCLTGPLPALAPGELAFGIVVCPDLRLAAQALRYVDGATKAIPALAHRTVSSTATTVTIRRDDGQEVVIECLPASRGGSALRGRTVVAALFDECAFFRDEASVVNDAELYRAVLPRIVPGGQLLMSSTPWAESGLLFELFAANHGSPSTCTAVRAPTTLMRTDAPHILRMVAREAERDPENTAREYGAEFMTRGAGLFFDGIAIDQAIAEYPLPQPPRGRVLVAVDAAFVKDSSAFAAVGVDAAGVVEVLALEEITPAKGSPLAPSAVVARWAELAKPYGVRSVRADGHYREALREHLAKHELDLESVPEGASGKRAMYERTRALMNEGKLRIPNHRRLVKQLREVVSKPTPGGGLSISSPRKGGAHGDLVSALVAAVHACVADDGALAFLEAMTRRGGAGRTLLGAAPGMAAFVNARLGIKR